MPMATSEKPSENTGRKRDALRNNLVYGMDARPGHPVEFLDTVMDRMEFPKGWDRVKGPMRK